MKRIFFFLSSPSASSGLLLFATVIGLLLANSPANNQYFNLVHAPLGALTVEQWVNDALMAIFFLFVGLEVKREMLFGELNTNAKRVLPGIAALAGVAAPALIFYFIVGNHPEYIKGWAVPTATDIAFALGVIGALGNRVPTAMKVFLTALAIIDDLIAILIIAIFYAGQLNYFYLICSGLITACLYYCNRAGYVRPMPYIFWGIALWVCVLKSGLHATMAGVILALMIPASGMIGNRHIYPMAEWEHALSNWVNFLIVPIFAFVNAGVNLLDFSWSDLLHPVVIGVVIALVLGKQLGIFGTVFVMIKAGIISMPLHTNWRHIYGTATVCGIGFTMSLFVSLLAFEPGHVQSLAKAGVFIASIIAGLLGYAILAVGAKQIDQ